MSFPVVVTTTGSAAFADGMSVTVPPTISAVAPSVAMNLRIVIFFMVAYAPFAIASAGSAGRT